MGKGFWRHERSMDAIILVLKVQYTCHKYVKLKIEWFVRGNSVGIKQNVKIMREDFPKWYGCNYMGDRL